MKLAKSFAILLFLTSCVEVGFKHPMPPDGKILAKIPQEMIGFYSKSRSDTASGDINGVQVNNYNKEVDYENSLTENTILKKWKGKYFLNQKEDSLWLIIMIVPTANNKFETYQLDGGNEQTVKLLKEITEIKEIYNKDRELDLLILDPTNKEFNKIIKSGAFEIIDIY